MYGIKFTRKSEIAKLPVCLSDLDAKELDSTLFAIAIGTLHAWNTGCLSSDGA